MASDLIRSFRNCAAAGGFSGELKFEEPLAPHTYYRIGGPAAVFAVPRGLDDLRWLAGALRTVSAPLFILGGGCNLLVSDLGFPGIVVSTHALNNQLRLGEQSEGDVHRVCAGTSVRLGTLTAHAAQKGWQGLEFLAGIPGSVGGAVCMNAGAAGAEVKDCLKRVEVFCFSGVESVFEGPALRFSYRKNGFLPVGGVIYSTEWEMMRGEPAAVRGRIDALLVKRKAAQPLDRPSCGSVFMNPSAELPAWRVIERIGLRAHRIGDAQFSAKHCNFIVNLGKARASDVRALMDLAKERAARDLGITLVEEVRSVGQF